MNCSKCGHAEEEHSGSRGYCRGTVGPLECKCASFANNPPIKNPEQFGPEELLP